MDLTNFIPIRINSGPTLRNKLNFFLIYLKRAVDFRLFIGLQQKKLNVLVNVSPLWE